MKCPNCGREGTGSLERCTACGTILSAALNTGMFPSDGDSPTFMGASVAMGSFPSPGGFVPPPPRQETPETTHGPLHIGEAFGHRYHIIRLLGMGGMGAVYQAWDSELGIAVAIKVVLPDNDPEAAAEVQRRFKRELLLARQVTHKNVVRIHDLGEIDGIKYITMSFVEGDDLATLLRVEKRLPVPRALGIARHIVDGLVAAHAEGIVHRDLKPANIMIDVNGDAVIMDFGIARSTGTVLGPQPGSGQALTGARGALHLNRTMVGTVVGTIPYMAPEQAGGQEVDQRADIYSFGLIFYDMLLGPHRSETTGSVIDELKGRMVSPPPSPRTLMPEIPEPVDRVVTRCLQPDPGRRFTSSAELLAALNRLDDHGKVIHIARRVTKPLVAATAVLVVALLAGTYVVTRRAVAPPVQHDPVTVLIADFQNQTGDPAFDRSLESVLKLALEGAGFITAYDRTGVRALGATETPETLDERKAQEIAVKQGVGVVISGVLNREGNSYGISLKATQTVTGNVITSTSSRASGKDRVLAAATSLATTVRTALGDETSDSTSQIFAMDTLSATNLDVVRQYAVATEAASRSRHEEALQGFSKSVELDPNFGMGYQGMALASQNLDRQQDAQKYIKEALRHLDQMTERERFRARGFFYRVSGDYQACVKEYGDLIARYAADVAAHNQIALCSTYLRDMPRAIDEMQRAVKIVPKSTILRNNLAVYSAYSGNFDAAEQEARAIEPPAVRTLMALAFGQLGQGRVPQAIEAYQKLQTLGTQGASRAISGLGDTAIYEGRFAEAARILAQGAAADAAAKEPNRAAAKFAALAYANLLRGRNPEAIAAAKSALESSQTVKVRFLAGRTLAEAGDISTAQKVAASLASELQAEPKAHGKIIDGLIALKRGDAPQAIKVLTEANGLLDTWIGHFDLGRAYFEAGQFIQADSEFDRGLKRRGEAMSLFLDEDPTYGYFPAVYYYQGRVREALNSAAFADTYRAYLDIRGKSSEDSLLPDVRKRASR
jgi:serine/threonine-protein kinase